MNYNQIIFPLAGTVLASTTLMLHADDSLWPAKDRVQLGYRMGFDISLKLRNVGAAPAANNPSFNGKSYNDGFVGTDNTGNAGGLTTDWGYQNANQVVDTAPNNYLVMHNSGSGTIASDLADNVNHGLELTWDHELARYEHVRWGFESAFNWMDVCVDKAVVAPSGVLGADAFPLGYIPPTPPYTGTPVSGPFIPLLGTTPVGLPVTVSSDFDANLYGFRLGPYLDVPLNKRLLLTFSAGLAVTIVDGDFSYSKSYLTPGGTSISVARRASKVGAVPGGYVGAAALLKLGSHVSLFTGLQYQGTDSYKIRAGDKEAEMDFTGALYWSTGLSYSF